MRASGNRAGRLLGFLFASVCAGVSFASSARADDASELWPELNGFLQLNERSSAFFGAAYALGQESDLKSADIAASVEVSLKPIARMRTDLLTED